MMEQRNDAELVALARHGDKEAFGALASRHEADTRRRALSLTGDPDLASELVQEATVRAYLSLDHLIDPSRFKGWLHGILRNVHHSHLRDQRQVHDLDAIQESLKDRLRCSDSESPETLAEETDLHNAVQDAFDRLPSVDRKTLSLFYFDDMSIAEIARDLEISEAAARVRIHRARKKLKEVLERYSPEIIPRIGRNAMVEVSIMDVIKNEQTDAEGKPYTMYVIVLADKARQRVLPIWIGVVEGQSIVQGLARFSMLRPMTLDLMAKLMEAAGASVEHVRVESLKEETFYGVIRLRGNQGTQEVDARPSDALALAVRVGCPILVSDTVFDQASLAVPPGTAGDGAGIRSVVKELDGIRQRWDALPKVGKERVRRMNKDLLADLLKQR